MRPGDRAHSLLQSAVVERRYRRATSYFVTGALRTGAFLGASAGAASAGAAATAGFGREAKVSKARRGNSRASSETMSRPSRKLRNQIVKTRILRSHIGT